MDRRTRASLGPQGTRNDTVVSSLRFLFWLTYPRHGAEEAGQPEMPSGTYRTFYLTEALSINIYSSQVHMENFPD